MLKRLACVGLLVTAACSTSYTPKPRPGLTPVLEGGQLDAVKHGQRVEVGRFGGGLVDAVSDNPRALEEAETFRGLRVGGFVVELVGLGGVVAGTFLVGYNEARDRRHDLRVVGYGTMLGGLVVEMIGVIIEAAADPHFFDAINIYNDGLDSAPYLRMPPPPRAYPPVPQPGAPAPVAPPPPAPPPGELGPPAPEPAPEPEPEPEPEP